MKKFNVIKIIALVELMVMVCSCFIGCRKPYDKPEFVTIEPSQTAFLVPLVGDSSNQASFESEEMLLQARSMGLVSKQERVVIIDNASFGVFSYDLGGRYSSNIKEVSEDNTPHPVGFW